MSRLFIAVASVLAYTQAIVLHSQGFEVAGNSTLVERPGRVHGAGFLHIPIAKKYNTKPTQKRQSLDGLRNDISGYSIQIGIGTPPQLVEVQIDTGSSQLWVNPTCANAWYPYGCTQNGFYVSASSSSKQIMSQAFSITYGLGSVSGSYIKDNIAMGGANMIAQQFGGATTSADAMEGIMGVGWGYGMDTSYYNVIDQLAMQGITHSRAFSLDLASIDVAQGSIIFGGIDTMKYTGALEKRPIVPYYLAPDGYPRYWIYMTSLGVTTPGFNVSIPVTSPPTLSQPIFPDSGSTFCYLPSALFAGLLAFFPSAVNQGGSQYTVPCSLRTQSGTIDFGFGGTTIHVSYHEFFWFDGAECWLAAAPSTEFYLLGDSFMRSTYIVYDQDNSNVLLAQAANCGSNIIPITTGPNAVPSVIGGCTPSKSPFSSSASLTSTSKPTSTRISSSSSSSKLSSSSSTAKPPGKLSPSSTSSFKSNISTSSSASSVKSSSCTLSSSPASTCKAATVTVTAVSTTQAHRTCTAVGQTF